MEYGEALAFVRQKQVGIYHVEEVLPIALEMYLYVFAMKKSHRQGGLFMADAYAQLVGLDPDAVYRQAHDLITENEQ